MGNDANLAGLKAAIQEKLGVPVAEQQLSKNPALVREGRLGRSVATAAPCWPVALLAFPLLLCCHRTVQPLSVLALLQLLLPAVAC